MNRKIVGIGVGMGIMLAASAVAVRAQNSPTGAGIDAALHGAVERKDVPGVLKAETVALMGQNNIGAVSVPALKTALPRSADFTFIADGRDKWGLGFLITTDQAPGKRSPGSLSWGGINNTYFWIDPSRGIAGVILMQYLPFADAKALAVYDAFERGAYQLATAER
jgi:methyl acetate hydrolase